MTEAVERESMEFDVVIVGAGPAGAMLSLLLARAGVSVTLLEAHKDFDRDFRTLMKELFPDSKKP